MVMNSPYLTLTKERIDHLWCKAVIRALNDSDIDLHDPTPLAACNALLEQRNSILPIIAAIKKKFVTAEITPKYLTEEDLKCKKPKKTKDQRFMENVGRSVSQDFEERLRMGRTTYMTFMQRKYPKLSPEQIAVAWLMEGKRRRRLKKTNKRADRAAQALENSQGQDGSESQHDSDGETTAIEDLCYAQKDNTGVKEPDLMIEKSAEEELGEPGSSQQGSKVEVEVVAEQMKDEASAEPGRDGNGLTSVSASGYAAQGKPAKEEAEKTALHISEGKEAHNTAEVHGGQGQSNEEQIKSEGDKGESENPWPLKIKFPLGKKWRERRNMASMKNEEAST